MTKIQRSYYIDEALAYEVKLASAARRTSASQIVSDALAAYLLVDRVNAIEPLGVPHVVKEGSRLHVISWSNLGRRCSEPNCEINFQSSPHVPRR